MMTLFEQQSGNYQIKGDYFIPCVVTKDQKEVHIGVWVNRHRQYLKQFHRVRYYNLLTSEKLYGYLHQCTESKDHVKLITRHVWEEYMEKAEDIRHTVGNKEIYQQRKETIE